MSREPKPRFNVGALIDERRSTEIRAFSVALKTCRLGQGLPRLRDVLGVDERLNVGRAKVVDERDERDDYIVEADQD